MFDIREGRYPRNWQEMSRDMLLFVGFHISNMLLMGLGPQSLVFELGLLVSAALFIFLIALHQRRQEHWHWPGVNRRDIAEAGIFLLLGLFFAGAAFQNVAPSDPKMLPWFAALAGIIVFGVF